VSPAGLTWRIYNDDTDAYSDDPQDGSVFGAIPQVSALKGVTLLDANSLTHFAADLQRPYTCQYTFIEPNYGDITSSYRGGSSQHPMDDVYGGEGLIKAVYEAIRNSPVWDTSLLIITYDEHGGFYDSVKPPAATPPNDGSPSTHNQWGFTFAQLGYGSRPWWSPRGSRRAPSTTRSTTTHPSQPPSSGSSGCRPSPRATRPRTTSRPCSPNRARAPTRPPD
jgi:phospholipase C